MQLGQQRSEAVRKFRQAHSPPLLFRAGGMTGRFLTSNSTRLSSQAATALCTVTVQHCRSPKLTSCSVLAQATPSPGERKGKGDMPLAGETPEHQHPQQGWGSHCRSPSGSPAHPHPPACLQLLPISDGQMRINNAEKALDTAQRGLTSGRRCKKT